ncbi:WD40 repeat-like protein [Daedalea quercina L-15889]|uniref:WD40 repeat-like protein n=1 Tax=Daedalea quercina L-15889 TaxID=1314783 RepID=A0A165UCT9_9APHY|nr:WD40 repeat-like protein [Daedalea quercina L-15889]
MPSAPAHGGSPNTDPDIQYIGFHRVDLDKSATHKAKLEEDGVVFCGFMESPRPISPPRTGPSLVIDLCVSDDEDDDGRGPSTAGPSNSASSRSTSSPRRPDSTSRSTSSSTQPSDKTSAGTPKGASMQPRRPLKPSASSALAKRAIPGEFTIPGTAKRRKKEEQRQSRDPPPSVPAKPSSKRRHSTGRSPSTSVAPREVIAVDDLSEDEPVAKRPRRKESPTAQSPPVEPSHAPEARSHTPLDRMTLSGGDFVAFVPSAPSPEPRDDNGPYDSEDEYDELHDAFRLDRRSNWKEASPFERARAREDEDLSKKLAAMSVAPQQPGPSDTARRHQLKGRINKGRHTMAFRNDGYDGEPFVWTLLRRHLARRPDGFPMLRHLHPVGTLDHAPGGVNRIAQCNGIIAIASSASGGDEDPAVLSAVDPYNREGTLLVWREGKPYTLLGHKRLIDDAQPSAVATSLAPVKKHYTVQDVQFNPAFPNRIVSSANDRTVRIWDCDRLSDSDSSSGAEAAGNRGENGGENGGQGQDQSQEQDQSQVDKDSSCLVDTIEYSCTMGKLLFKPGEPVLAMGGHDGRSVYLLRDEDEKLTQSHLRLSRTNTDETGDIAWGLGVLSDRLFASSMTKGEKAFGGTHKAFDVKTERPICTMGIQEAGDSIAVHPAGTLVAIATKPSKHAHSLYLFDGRRLSPSPVCRVELDAFQQTVTTMKFSPDGTYLALARDDNTTDVYDARFLGHGKLHAFTHEPGNVLTYTKDVYGVVEAQWVEGCPSGLGIVTGGCDGCVRLWDVRLADNDPDNGLPIAQCEHDLGHFSLGDISKNEMPLVTGEMSGKVTLFERRGWAEVR